MSTGTEPTPAGGGLKSVLKIAVPLGALFAIVFGLAYMTQYTPSDDPKGPRDADRLEWNDSRARGGPIPFAPETSRRQGPL